MNLLIDMPCLRSELCRATAPIEIRALAIALAPDRMLGKQAFFRSSYEQKAFLAMTSAARHIRFRIGSVQCRCGHLLAAARAQSTSGEYVYIFQTNEHNAEVARLENKNKNGLLRKGND